MIMTLTEHDFLNLTNQYSQHKDNFSYEGKKALFNYLEEYEEDTSDTIEFDYIALCVDYSEYDNLDEVFEVYDLSILKALTLTELKEHTEVIEFTKYDNNKHLYDLENPKDINNPKDREYKSYIIRDF